MAHSPAAAQATTTAMRHKVLTMRATAVASWMIPSAQSRSRGASLTAVTVAPNSFAICSTPCDACTSRLRAQAVRCDLQLPGLRPRAGAGMA